MKSFKVKRNKLKKSNDMLKELIEKDPDKAIEVIIDFVADVLDSSYNRSLFESFYFKYVYDLPEMINNFQQE